MTACFLEGEVRIDHHVDELYEINRRSPSQHDSGLCGVAEQVIHLGRSMKSAIYGYVPLVVEPDPFERDSA